MCRFARLQPAFSLCVLLTVAAPAPAQTSCQVATAGPLADHNGFPSIGLNASSCLFVDFPQVGITTVDDTVTLLTPPVSDCPGGFGYFPNSTVLFTWYSLDSLPGGVFFPKIFSSGLDPTVPNAQVGNGWQTTLTLIVSPGIVSVQDVCFPNSPADPPPPILGPINFFNAQAWSLDLTGGAAAAAAPAIESAGLTSTLTLPGKEPIEVRLRSTVRPEGNGFRYRYIFENVSGQPLSIDWESAGFSRTVGSGQRTMVSFYSPLPARESPGYAHILADDVPVADMVSMALVPMAAIGDLDGNGIVEFQDLTALLAAWGPCPVGDGASCAADLDGDGLVGITDMLLLLGNWGDGA